MAVCTRQQEERQHGIMARTRKRTPAVQRLWFPSRFGGGFVLRQIDKTSTIFSVHQRFTSHQVGLVGQPVPQFRPDSKGNIARQGDKKVKSGLGGEF